MKGKVHAVKNWLLCVVWLPQAFFSFARGTGGRYDARIMLWVVIGSLHLNWRLINQCLLINMYMVNSKCLSTDMYTELVLNYGHLPSRSVTLQIISKAGVASRAVAAAKLRGSCARDWICTSYYAFFILWGFNKENLPVVFFCYIPLAALASFA